MITQKVTTSSELNNLETDNFVHASQESPKSEIQTLTNFFELLSKIDQRLKIEDQEYRKKYYPEQSLGKEML